MSSVIYQKIIMWLGSLLSLLAIATIALVWMYHAPALASLSTRVLNVEEHYLYIRNKLDDISKQLPKKK